MTPYDLALVQGQRFQAGFRWLVDGAPRPLADYAWRAQVRAKERIDSELLLDLAPHLSVDADGVTLWLNIPASITYALDARRFRDETSWDLFLWPAADPDDAIVLVQGHVTCDPAASAVP